MPSEGVGPLAALSLRLRSLAPPSLSALTARFGEVEEYNKFVDLVREFLPEREQDILHETTPEAQMAAFASYFQDRYFPLNDRLRMGDVEGYRDLVYGIPVVVYGLGYEEYHYIASDWQEGIILMTYLVEDPYEGDTRVALAEACSGHVPQNLLQRVPEGGFSCAELHRCLDDTKYKALAAWADMVWTQADNFFLDMDLESLWQDGLPEWDMRVVQDLTTQWQQAEAIRNEIFELIEWLEEDPAKNFAKLIKFILRRHEKATHK